MSFFGLEEMPLFGAAGSGLRLYLGRIGGLSIFLVSPHATTRIAARARKGLGVGL